MEGFSTVALTDGEVFAVLDTARWSPAEKRYIYSAAFLQHNSLMTYHVTDFPEKVLRALQQGQSLIETFPEHDELGPGLYASQAIELWKGRSVKKWSPFAQLSLPQAEQLATLILTHDRMSRLDEVDRMRVQHYVDDFLSYSRGINPFTGTADIPPDFNPLHYLAHMICNQPFNIHFWKDWKKLGLTAPAGPNILELQLQGRFAELPGMPTRQQWQELAQQVDGAYLRGPEMVIWNAASIRSVGDHATGQPYYIQEQAQAQEYLTMLNRAAAQRAGVYAVAP
jgi:hypothetical protein